MEHITGQMSQIQGFDYGSFIRIAHWRLRKELITSYEFVTPGQISNAPNSFGIVISCSGVTRALVAENMEIAMGWADELDNFFKEEMERTTATLSLSKSPDGDAGGPTK